MKLKQLLIDVECEYRQEDGSREITSVVYSSREVQEGSLFICIRGFQADGHRYIPQAVAAGAAAVLIEEAEQEKTDGSTERPPAAAGLSEAYRAGVAVVRTADTRRALALISAAWFGYPASRMTMIGITGTKGKTTTAHMICRILEAAGHKAGMIGTMGAFIGGEKFPTRNTTPESFELHSLFARMYEEGCRYVVMEVSSQGLKQRRTEGILFDYGLYLNISPDHIGTGPGEHEDFDEYLACKRLLFSQVRHAVANRDDVHWREITGQAPDVCTFSHRKEADFYAADLKKLWEPGILGSSFSVRGRVQEELAVGMPGEFNVENALAAAAVTALLGIGEEARQTALRRIAVKGRTQLLPETPKHATFIIDYAHNALSMESLLKMLKGYEPKRLICLFGGGGNRPRQRRFDMGEMAGKYADLTILTMDNPRDESMESINADIVQGLNVYGGRYDIIPDREDAIHYLLESCGTGDIVALIGKGHEEYQEVRGVKYYFSEEKIVLDYLRDRQKE